MTQGYIVKGASASGKPAYLIVSASFHIPSTCGYHRSDFMASVWPDEASARKARAKYLAHVRACRARDNGAEEARVAAYQVVLASECTLPAYEMKAAP